MRSARSRSTMKIAFINPPSGLDRDFYEIPLNIAYLIACVRARKLPVDFEVIDLELFTDRDPWAQLDGRVVVKPRRPLIRDLDRVPLATDGYDCFDLDEVRRLPNFIPFMASRGCPFQCIFCSSADLWEHRINYRSPANIRRELEEIRA